MKDFKQKRYGRDALGQSPGKGLVRVRLMVATILFCAALAGVSRVISHAQRLYVPVKVSSVSSQTSASGSVVTIAADTTLARAQTWQDEEGFHVVLPNTVATDSLKPARGVKVRRIGTSLEILAQTKPGTRVSLSSAQNQLNLVIDGKLEARSNASAGRVTSSSPEESSLFEDPKSPKPDPNAASPSISSTVDEMSKFRPAGDSYQPAGESSSVIVQDLSQTGSNQIVPQGENAQDTAIVIEAEEESLLASIFSGTSVVIVLALGLFGILLSRKIRSKQELAPATPVAKEEFEEFETPSGNRQFATPNTQGSTQSLVRVAETLPANRVSRQQVARVPVAGPAALYGAYRIDQEVGKLILGQAHRIDVLASRAVDDRRAIEASLIKGVNSTELGESAQRRAREALEEYGFVARQCAALLLAPEAFERTSAARALGEIKSAASLPFLLESLYDSEAIVRNQAVVSIGELKLPSAIGALLDIARTHPDVSSSLLSRTLSACSVEGLDFFDAVLPGSSLLGPGDVGSIIQGITHLEPASAIESLPPGCDDELFTQALFAVESSDVEERSEALKILVQFRVQSAVDAIEKVAGQDPASTIRSHAISSLGSINHESVFATVLIGMADESREVRAAAARSVNRLSFDRADAYVRVIETSDEETLRCVAKACIQAGIVSQNLDRLTNADHRQAYETFSLICLLTKAGMNEPVLEAIANHPRVDVRLKAVHLLGRTGHPDTFGQLRELAVKDGIGEVVKTALLEAMYKVDQNRLKDDEIVDDFVARDDSQLQLCESEILPVLVEPEVELEVPVFEADIQEEADELEI